MTRYFEFLITSIAIIVFIFVCSLVVVEYVKQLNKEELQKVTYEECIKTDYDKFQCYSMIYGDK
jgi:type III secretory pathway component EscR